MPSATDQLLRLLELTARESPDLLPHLVQLSAGYPAGFALTEIVRLLGVRPEQLPAAMVKASRDLDRLERLRSWVQPRDVVSRPNLHALLHLCHARAQNVPTLGRRRRLQVTTRKLTRAIARQDREALQKRIADFIAGAAPAGAGHATDGD